MYYDANNAVDRNTTTCTRTAEIGIYNPHNTVWWKVDLGRVYSIYSINILFKNYDGYGMWLCIHSLMIMVFWNDNCRFKFKSQSLGNQYLFAF